MGLASAMASMRASRALFSAMRAGSAPVASILAISTASSRGLSRNSCSGGSSRRMIIGWPLMVSSIWRKSPSWASVRSLTARSLTSLSSERM